eukprot:Sspe_Gene.20356::Locus_7458_Transcript_1_1_Confidence_1.000_Length_3404::g.20356::m.20356
MRQETGRYGWVCGAAHYRRDFGKGCGGHRCNMGVGTMPALPERRLEALLLATAAAAGTMGLGYACRLRRKPKERHQSDGFESLPVEIHTRILRFLPAAALGALSQASQRMHDLATDEEIWKQQWLDKQNTLAITIQGPVDERGAKWVLAIQDGKEGLRGVAATPRDLGWMRKPVDEQDLEGPGQYQATFTVMLTCGTDEEHLEERLRRSLADAIRIEKERDIAEFGYSTTSTSELVHRVTVQSKATLPALPEGVPGYRDYYRHRFYEEEYSSIITLERWMLSLRKLPRLVRWKFEDFKKIAQFFNVWRKAYRKYTWETCPRRVQLTYIKAHSRNFQVLKFASLLHILLFFLVTMGVRRVLLPLTRRLARRLYGIEYLMLDEAFPSSHTPFMKVVGEHRTPLVVSILAGLFLPISDWRLYATGNGDAETTSLEIMNAVLSELVSYHYVKDMSESFPFHLHIVRAVFRRIRNLPFYAAGIMLISIPKQLSSASLPVVARRMTPFLVIAAVLQMNLLVVSNIKWTSLAFQLLRVFSSAVTGTPSEFYKSFSQTQQELALGSTCQLILVHFFTVGLNFFPRWGKDYLFFTIACRVLAIYTDLHASTIYFKSGKDNTWKFLVLCRLCMRVLPLLRPSSHSLSSRLFPSTPSSSNILHL